MIELGALLGAVVAMHGALSAPVPADDLNQYATQVAFGLVGAPILGALWGAGVAAAIHFTVDGTLPGLLLGLLLSLFGAQ